jgi:hypothetical protein
LKKLKVAALAGFILFLPPFFNKLISFKL